MFGFGVPPPIIDLLFKWALAIGCVGFCLAVGLVYLIYIIIAYKASKQTPPASDNDGNPKD